MDAVDSSNLLKLTNSSGFIFQLGVRHEIERTTKEHGWQVLTEEHHWRHPETGESRYADLVIKHSSLIVKLVVECKRATDRPWVFLVPKDPAVRKKPQPLSLLLVSLLQDNRKVVRWVGGHIDPASRGASFCVVEGQGQKQTPMIERIADELLPAVEMIGLQELSLLRPGSMAEVCFFMPLLVTNARLCTCEFDPGMVDMSTGMLQDGAFEDLPFVRFRKALSSTLDESQTPMDLSEANQLRERSLLVVRSTAIVGLLKSLAVSFQRDRGLGSLLARLDQEGARSVPGIDSRGSRA